MIYRLDSSDSEHDRVGQQWVFIYRHDISSSNMKKDWLQWRSVVFTSIMKKGWLHKLTFTSNMKKGWLRKVFLIQHEKGLAPRFSSSKKKDWL